MPYQFIRDLSKQPAWLGFIKAISKNTWECNGMWAYSSLAQLFTSFWTLI